MNQLEPGNMVMTYKPKVVTEVLAIGIDEFGQWVDVMIEGEIETLDRCEVIPVRVEPGELKQKSWKRRGKRG